jgi:hypothetical protein
VTAAPSSPRSETRAAACRSSFGSFSSFIKFPFRRADAQLLHTLFDDAADKLPGRSA